jgi:hypothetical protein
MNYTEELEKQNDELQQKLAKQQEENIALKYENQFAAKWIPIMKVNYPSDPEMYHFVVGNAVVAMVFLDRNKNMQWNRRIFCSNLANSDFCYSDAKTAMHMVECFIWGKSMPQEGK